MLSRRLWGPPLLLRLTSICAIGLAMGVGVFSVPAGAAVQEDVLIKVDSPAPDHWALLESLGARSHFRTEDYAVVAVDVDDLALLDEGGLSWTLLRHDPSKSLFYVIQEPGAGSPGELGFDVLVSDDDGALASAEVQTALEARRRGLKVMPLDAAWPVRGSDFRDLKFVHEEVVPNGDFRRLVSRVEPDSIGSYIQHLEDYGTRYTYSPQILAAGSWLLRRLWGFGYTDTLLQPVKLEGKISIAPGNVVATKPGSTRPDYRILVGGHYDSIVDGGGAAAVKRAPGADDNASGTAAALEVARLLAGVELDATVQFVLFTAEEQGLLGSLEFVTILARENHPKDKLFFINMDMIGNADTLPWHVRIYHNSESLPFAELMRNVGTAYSGVIPVLSGAMGRSDHASFWSLGYPAVFVHERDFSPNYHSVDDLLVDLEMDYETEVVKMVLATVLHLAKKSGPPGEVTAYRDEAGDVHLEWSHSPDADVLGYHVEVTNGEGKVVESLYTDNNFAVLPTWAVSETTWVTVSAEDILGEGEPSKALFIGSGPRLLASPVPNVTRGGSTIGVFVPGIGPPPRGSVRIVDAAGRLVRTLYEGPIQRGTSSFQWDGEYSNGGRAPAGVYFAVVTAAGWKKAREKIIVAR